MLQGEMSKETAKAGWKQKRSMSDSETDTKTINKRSTAP